MWFGTNSDTIRNVILIFSIALGSYFEGFLTFDFLYHQLC